MGTLPVRVRVPRRARERERGVPEQYLVMVDGHAVTADLVGRGGALRLALAAVDAMQSAEVAVADARTLQVCARWRRNGVAWEVRAVDGWLN